MSSLSPPPRKPVSVLDHQGGLSLWLRAAILTLALLVAARPDRWAWSPPSLHDVCLWLFAYSIVGEVAAALFAVIAPIAIFAALVLLLCFDRMVYVPAFRLMRIRFKLSTVTAFCAAVAIEGAVAGALILAASHRANWPVREAPRLASNRRL